MCTTAAKTSAAATTVAGTANPPASVACAKCGTNNAGKLSCCVRGGSWFQKCGPDGDHTWAEGVESCQSELVHNGIWISDHLRVLGDWDSVGLCCLSFTNARIMCSAVAATAAGATPTPASVACPKCGTNKAGKISCCARGGSWFQNCGEFGDSKFDHTWGDGIQSCQSELEYEYLSICAC